jgi:carboxymethylenebutenolidase
MRHGGGFLCARPVIHLHVRSITHFQVSSLLMIFDPFRPGRCLVSLFLITSGFTAASTEGNVTERNEVFISGGKKIKVETFVPPGAGRVPTVIVLHSSAGTIAGKKELVAVCREIAADGKMALLVHYYNRTGTLWSGDEKIDRLWPTWADTVKNSVSYAISHPRSRPDSIGMFGYSLGAFLAVAVASQDARVSAVVEVAGGIFDTPRPTLRRMPSLLILHGRADERVPVDRAFELTREARRLGERPEIKIYAGEGHVLSEEAMADAISRTLRFFRENLPAG